jgi:NodT family efflux transporter outer membrane factor (OMF) lipoprotein
MLLLSGCATVGPNYARPAIPAPATWNASSVAGIAPIAADDAMLGRWWNVLNDPLLTSLIDAGLRANLDVRRAEARVREARARRGGASAERFPSVSGGFSASATSTGDNGSGQSAGVGAQDRGADFYSGALDARWEVDLFGKRTRALEAATADLEASVEDVRDVHVSLASEIALSYLELRLAQQRLMIAEANLQAQRETYDIARWRFEAGLTTQLDVEQARFNLEQTRAQLPTLRATQERTAHRITVLLGEAPGSRQRELTTFHTIPVPPASIAVGLPADLLRRRPDVRRAERHLAAQTARVGVATADKYPDLSLTGSIGLEALSLGSLFSTAARVLTAGLNVGQTIVDAGRVRQNIAVQAALTEQAQLAYESEILSALEEVENALVAFAEEHARRAALVEATDAARRAASLADDQYRSGLVDFQRVLDAQRSLLAFEDQLAVSGATVTSNLVRLYKALGGGWTSQP